MLSFFKGPTSPSGDRPKVPGERAARNAKLRAFYSDPLPTPAPPLPFNVFQPSTYPSLFHQPAEPCIGVWNPATRSVDIVNDAEGIEIWRRGMWGKGTLSRSQPSWRERKTKEMNGGGRELSLEELTAMKRRERAEFKEERLRHERMERERQLRAEGKLTTGETTEPVEVVQESTVVEEKPKRKRQKLAVSTTGEIPNYSEEYLDKECLQLSPEEALFLLQINLLVITHENSPLTLSQFLHLVTSSSAVDDPFLIKYIVYYHFRRQRLIVKPGLKFGVDYLLYAQPIPISHAAHCVNILAVYPEKYEAEKFVKESVTWREINMWQRLMGNVRKKLKLVYVLIPEQGEGMGWRDVDKEGWMGVLGRYKVREVENRRMVIARERDVKPGK